MLFRSPDVVEGQSAERGHEVTPERPVVREPARCYLETQVWTRMLQLGGKAWWDLSLSWCPHTVTPGLSSAAPLDTTLAVLRLDWSSFAFFSS